MSILRHRTHDNGSMAQEVGSVLGLHNTYSSYPFMDTRTTGHRWEELLRIVPQRTEVLRWEFPYSTIFFYLLNGEQIFPVLPSIVLPV